MRSLQTFPCGVSFFCHICIWSSEKFFRNRKIKGILPTRIDSRITAYINAGFFSRPEGLIEKKSLILPIFLYP